MSGRKKKLEFTVKPPKSREGLPADPDGWVYGENAPEKEPEKRPAVPHKRLTLNLPEALHKAFKGRCVREGVTIQDKVHALILRELASAWEGDAPAPGDVGA